MPGGVSRAGMRLKGREERSFDPALLGLWDSADGRVRITEDGWQYTVDSWAYAISPDGMTLTSPVGSPTIYQRTYGSGQTLVGVWTLNVVSEGVAYVEELAYRDDSSFSSYWTADGAFYELIFGTYSADPTTLTVEERRALVATAAPNLITFDRPFATDLTGTYAVASDGNSWTLDLGGKQIEYTRAVSMTRPLQRGERP